MSEPSSINGSRQTPLAETHGEPPRKRIRKGTKSCWECKRRKIRCQLSSEDVAVCSGCLTRGTTCLSQEYPEEHAEGSSGGLQVGERLGRVEQLLEKLVAKISQYDEEEKAAKISTPESMGANDVLTPGSNHIDNAPILSLFDNPVIGRRGDDTSLLQTISHSTSYSGNRTPSCRLSKEEKIQRVLVDLLPPQRDVDVICEESSCWLLIHAISSRTASALEPSDRNDVMDSIFNITEISRKSPVVVAKTLLYMCACSQQLPPDFDYRRLQLGESLESKTNKWMSTVSALVTSDDDAVSTIEGLECLILQGIFHINAGNPRRAWLVFRRSISIGQLMGVHRRKSTIPGGREMWFSILQADRYLALLLGLPAASTDNHFDPEETFQNPAVDKDALFNRKLCEIASMVIDRNQDQEEHGYALTQEIDERLDNLAKQMPESWWAIPTLMADAQVEEKLPTYHTRTLAEDAPPPLIYTNPQSSNILKCMRLIFPSLGTVEARQQFDHLIYQIWYFELKALVHLPFMLRSTTERRYDYSKFICLKASREMTYRYLATRGSNKPKAFSCKIIDFSALTATVTIALGLLHPVSATDSREILRQRDSDRTLVQTMLKAMQQLSVGGKDVIATQSANVIQTLLAVEQNAGSAESDLRITIPYFGTINIARTLATAGSGSGNTKITQQEQTVPLDQLRSQVWQNQPISTQSAFDAAPYVSFQSSHFPPVPTEQNFQQDWNLQSADTLLFDSLLSTDINDGNWLF